MSFQVSFPSLFCFLRDQRLARFKDNEATTVKIKVHPTQLFRAVARCIQTISRSDTHTHTHTHTTPCFIVEINACGAHSKKVVRGFPQTLGCPLLHDGPRCSYYIAPSYCHLYSHVCCADSCWEYLLQVEGLLLPVQLLYKPRVFRRTNI